MLSKRATRELIIDNIDIFAGFDHLVAPGGSLKDKAFQDVRCILLLSYSRARCSGDATHPSPPQNNSEVAALFEKKGISLF